MSTERQRRRPSEFTANFPYGEFDQGDRSRAGDYLERRAARQLAGLVLAVQEARRQRSWTQLDLAVEAGTSQQTISEFERGRVWPDLFILVKACDALDLDLRALPRTSADWS